MILSTDVNLKTPKLHFFRSKQTNSPIHNILPPNVSCGWPKGTYGLPKPKWGCPSSGKELSQWHTGKRLHKTEFGSTASDNTQLAGTVSIPKDSVVQEFCIKTSDDLSADDDGVTYFMPGQYCIFKKGACPFSFDDGWIYWDDGAPLRGPTSQTHSGVMPDGVFDRNTKIFYCCRKDGHPVDQIILPAVEPFFLLKNGHFCQQVLNMDVEEQWVLWYDEKTVNLDASDGMHPKLLRDMSPSPSTKLFYCYYTPKTVGIQSMNTFSTGSRLHTFIVAGYVIGATVGFVLIISIVLTAVQRALLMRQIRAARECRSETDDDPCRSSSAANAVAAEDHPPPYDVAVMCPAPNAAVARAASASTASETGSASVPLVTAVEGATSDVVRPPSYTEFLRENGLPPKDD